MGPRKSVVILGKSLHARRRNSKVESAEQSVATDKRSKGLLTSALSFFFRETAAFPLLDPLGCAGPRLAAGGITRPLHGAPGCRLSIAHFSHLRLIVGRCMKLTRPPTNDSSSDRFASLSAHASDVPADHEQSVWAVSPDAAPCSSVSSPYVPYASHIPSDHDHSILHVSLSGESPDSSRTLLPDLKSGPQYIETTPI